jgi:hypothetical protein
MELVPSHNCQTRAAVSLMWMMMFRAVCKSTISPSICSARKPGHFLGGLFSGLSLISFRSHHWLILPREAASPAKFGDSLSKMQEMDNYEGRQPGIHILKD